MARFYLVGLGVHPSYITLEGLNVIRRVDHVFLESYTSAVPADTVQFVERLCGKRVHVVTREDIEIRNCERIVQLLNQGHDVALLVPGDPIIATTHNALRVMIRSLGHDVHVIYGVSIYSAVISLLGLSPYRVGPIATITYPRMDVYSSRPYEVVEDNLSRGLHTVLLLDVSDDGKFMTVNEAVRIMRRLEEIHGRGVFSDDRIAIGVARVGYANSQIAIDELADLEGVDLGEPPHVMVIPSRLSPVEYEVLVKVHNADPDLLKRLADKI